MVGLIGLKLLKDVPLPEFQHLSSHVDNQNAKATDKKKPAGLPAGECLDQLREGVDGFGLASLVRAGGTRYRGHRVGQLGYVTHQY